MSGMSDVGHFNGLSAFTAAVTSAVVFEHARRGVARDGLNAVLREEPASNPLFEERTVFESVRDAWRTEETQYTPRQEARRIAKKGY